MTNVMTNEILTEEQLDGVAGGTVWELEELARAMMNNLFLEGMTTLSLFVPGNSKLLKSEVTKTLDKIGVKADIDVNTLGFLGFNIGEKNNTYKDKFTGESLTHRQVLNRIKNFVS